MIQLIDGFTGLKLARILTLSIMMSISCYVQTSTLLLFKCQDHLHRSIPRLKMTTSMMTGPVTDGLSTQKDKSHSHHLMIQSGTRRKILCIPSISPSSQLSLLFRRMTQITNTMIGLETDGSSTQKDKSHSHHPMILSGTRRKILCIPSISPSSPLSLLFRRMTQITSTMIGPVTDGSSTLEDKSHSHHPMILSGTRRRTSCIQFTSQSNLLNLESKIDPESSILH